MYDNSLDCREGHMKKINKFICFHISGQKTWSEIGSNVKQHDFVPGSKVQKHDPFRSEG